MPMNIALSPDGRFIVTTDTGYYESLWSIRTSDGKGVSHIDYSNRPSAIGAETNPPTTRRVDESNGLYFGLAIAPDNTVYAAQGAHDTIEAFVRHDATDRQHVATVACGRGRWHEDVGIDWAANQVHGQIEVTEAGQSKLRVGMERVVDPRELRALLDEPSLAPTSVHADDALPQQPRLRGDEQTH